MERIPSGIPGLDALMEGGFPKGCLVLLAGNPGTGKTIFSAQFLHYGAEHGEKGVYVSFAEGRDAFHSYMKRFGMDFKRLEEEGKFRILDMVTVKEEGISTVLERILEEVYALGAKRLVIDSYSAMAQAFKEKIDSRIIFHVILGKIVREMGCTTLLILETPLGEERVGLGVEEFVADCVFILKKGALDGRLIREIEFVKLRGTRIKNLLYFFTLDQGFRVFSPLKWEIGGGERFQPIPDTDAYFSTGSEDMDRMLGKGYPKGSLVFLETGGTVSIPQYKLLLLPTLMNFVLQGRKCTAILSFSLSVDQAISLVKRVYKLEDEEVRNFIHFFVPKVLEEVQEKFNVVSLEGDFKVDLPRVKEVLNKLGKPLVYAVSLDTLEVLYGDKAIIGINICALRCRDRGDLLIMFSRLGLKSAMKKRVASISEVHLKIVREHGTLLLYGVKPRTGIYVVEIDVSKGYAIPKLIPIA